MSVCFPWGHLSLHSWGAHLLVCEGENPILTISSHPTTHRASRERGWEGLLSLLFIEKLLNGGQLSQCKQQDQKGRAKQLHTSSERKVPVPYSPCGAFLSHSSRPGGSCPPKPCPKVCHKVWQFLPSHTSPRQSSHHPGAWQHLQLGVGEGCCS